MLERVSETMTTEMLEMFDLDALAAQVAQAVEDFKEAQDAEDFKEAQDAKKNKKKQN